MLVKCFVILLSKFAKRDNGSRTKVSGKKKVPRYCDIGSKSQKLIGKPRLKRKRKRKLEINKAEEVEMR